MNARALVKSLGGQWHGTYGTARCPAHDDRAPSLSVTERDGKLLVHCHAGCGQESVVAALVDLEAWPKRDDRDERPVKTPSVSAGLAKATLTEAGPQTLAPKWRAFWNRCHPITPDSPAGRYLAGRCCALPSHDVRWHPETWHQHEKQTMSAMVALVTDICTAEPISLHFTFIAPDGSGKAAIERPRLYLAGHRKSGGVVRLDADEDVTQGIILGEGLETCLSYRLQFAPIWACLDAGNLAAFPVLPGIEAITILVDRDPAGEHAYATTRNRYRDAGFTHALDIIRIAAPEAGQDINDMAGAP